MKLKKYFLGVIAGFATGTLFGALFASGKGVFRRNKISNKLADLAEELKDKYEDLLTEIVQYIDTIKESRANIYLHPDKKK